ncbi:hypothetical protein [Trichlorobacter sp.]|uniref:hypothetical protein n=1 Tax=Trichlorobacter sp. TaxID=2911007 RepID=UPI002A35F6B1|nr:hypothetical protein [Trichlorobacter sp.]MDY0383206.1 hypothetical protein [Trichlorobacter sp.]
MTKFQKQMLTIAAAGALTAVTALPAMAFEHNFNGTFVAKTYLSNIDGNANGNVALTQENTKSNNFTDQRTRINYTAKASDDLKLVTQVEFQTWWGVENNAAGGGGDIDTDGDNLVVRYAYLDFNLGKNLNAKIGQQLFKDTFGGLYADADLPMARVTYKRGGYTLGLGYSRFNDEDTLAVADSYKGNVSADLYALENTYAFNKDTKVGMSYYLNRDDATATSSKRVNTLGLFGATKMGALDLSTFVAMQKGYFHNGATKANYHGWAANVLAKMKLGNGLARTGFLFTSGDNSDKASSNHGWQTLSSNVATSNGATAAQNSYNESGMMLLVRNTSMGGTSNDNYLRKPITNIALLHAGYNANLTEKLYANGNIGMAWLPASDYNYGHTSSGNVNGSDILGAEANVEVGYKLYPNLTLKAQAAYVKLGSAYKLANGNDPADPYTIRAGAYYSF